MKLHKKLLSVILTIILFGSVIPIGMVSVDAISSSGSCGDNATWKISNDTLTISGSGRMYAYSSDNEAPWYDYDLRKTYSKVVISSGITSVGAYAFYFCKNINSVSLPNTVTTLGKASFSNCNALRTINLPYGIKTIPDFCFDYCSVLENIAVPSSVKSFGLSAFEHTGIINFIIPDGVEELPYYLFGLCSQLETLTIPQSVTKIRIGAFYRCENLTDIYYNGTLLNYNKITIESNNESLLNATIHYQCEPGAHVYDNSCDDTCNVCGFVRTPPHEYSASCDTTCNLCKNKRTVTAKHVFTDKNDRTCNNCLNMRMFGDLTGDDKINSLDGLMLLRYLNGWNVNIANTEQIDVNGDGKENSLDGLILLRYLNGWELDLLPPDGSEYEYGDGGDDEPPKDDPNLKEWSSVELSVLKGKTDNISDKSAEVLVWVTQVCAGVNSGGSFGIDMANAAATQAKAVLLSIIADLNTIAPYVNANKDLVKYTEAGEVLFLKEWFKKTYDLALELSSTPLSGSMTSSAAKAYSDKTIDLSASAAALRFAGGN